MTLEHIKQRIEEIKQVAEQGDDEGAHLKEDALRRDVLSYIAKSEIHPYAEMARECLMTDEIEFARWCA